MSFLNYPQVKNYYIQNKCKILEDMLGKTKEMKEKIQENIDKFNKNLNSLQNTINNYINWLEDFNHNNQDYNNNMAPKDLNEDIRKNIKLFFDSAKIFYGINFNIFDSRKKIYDLFDKFINFDFFDFSPIESNIIITDSNLISTNDISFQFDDFQNFIQSHSFNDLNEVENEEQNSSRHDSNDKCIKCNYKKPCYCYLNKKYCKDCIIEMINKMVNEGQNPDLDDIIYFENKKELFMNSLEILIKTILLKFNFILNNESKASIDSENQIRRNIYKKINYPTIISNEYKDLDVDFMKKINLILKNDFNADFNNFSVKDFNLLNLNELIKESLKKIFKDKTILDANKINIIEDDDMSEMIEIDNLDVNNE